MKIRRFIMEDWLASYKDSCRYNLGESGFPNITVNELLDRCGESIASLNNIVLKDNDTKGTERIRTAIAATYGSPITLENISVTTGTSEALFILYNLLLEPDKSVIVPFPAFQALYEVPRGLGAQIKWYYLNPENSFIPDPDEICQLIDDSTGMVVINTPHNPSGKIIPPEYASAVIRKAAHHGAVVLADEHYRFLPHNGDYPIPSLARPEENVIAVGSITKCFGVIGLRMGWIAASQQLIAKICDFRDYLTHTLSPISDYLAALALENAPALIEHYIAILQKNTSELISSFREIPGLSVVPPEGGIVAFPHYEYDISSEDFASGLLKQQNVFVLPGNAFETERHFRINLGQPHDEFGRALDLIGKYCGTLLTKHGK